MTDTITIHVIAVDWYRRERGWRLDEIDRWPSRHPHCPAWLPGARAAKPCGTR